MTSKEEWAAFLGVVFRTVQRAAPFVQWLRFNEDGFFFYRDRALARVPFPIGASLHAIGEGSDGRAIVIASFNIPDEGYLGLAGLVAGVVIERLFTKGHMDVIHDSAMYFVKIANEEAKSFSRKGSRFDREEPV
jgi:hypothetical protein